MGIEEEPVLGPSMEFWCLHRVTLTSSLTFILHSSQTGLCSWGSAPAKTLTLSLPLESFSNFWVSHKHLAVIFFSALKKKLSSILLFRPLAFFFFTMFIWVSKKINKICSLKCLTSTHSSNRQLLSCCLNYCSINFSLLTISHQMHWS